MLAASTGSSSPDRPFSPALPDVAAGQTTGQGFEVQRDLLEPLSRKAYVALEPVLAPDCLLLLPGLRPVTGAALVLRVLRRLRRRYDVLHFETVLQFRSPDDTFVANSTVQGTRTDGLPYSNDVISVIRLDRSGRVALISDYFKDTADGGQAGKRPSPRHA